MSSVSSTTNATNTLGFLSTANATSTVNGGAATPSTLGGISSGWNTTAMVNAMMAVNQLPQAHLQAQLKAAQTNISLYQGLNADGQALQTAADALSTPSGWQHWTATSSLSEVTATAGAGAVGGTLTFSVERLASAGSIISSGSVSSTSAPVATGNLLVAAGGNALGLATVADGGGLSLGNHAIAVTQSSTGATNTATTALAAGTTITAGVNDTLEFSLDGVDQTVTLAAGDNLTPAQVAANVATASGGSLSTSMDNSGHLVIASAAEGSSHSLQVTNGTALASLGLSPDASAVSGTDGIVTVDGVATTISDVSAGSSFTLAGSAGTSVTATLAGGLRAGSITAAEVSTGDGTLNALVGAINSAGVGVTAAAIQTGASSYRLQVASTTTGANSAVNLAPNAFSALGAFTTLTAGTDSKLTVGTGPGAFSVSSATNAVTGLMPGVTLSLNSASPGTPVTVSLSPDGAAIAAAVSAMVTAANTLSTDLTSVTSYNPTTKSAGALLGDSTVTTLLHRVLSAVSGSVGSNGSGGSGAVGVNVNPDGSLTFDQAKFLAAFAKNPTAVANTFTQGARTSNPLVSFYRASDATQPGAYQINITQAAAQATATGANLAGGSISGDETLKVLANGVTATYAANAGQSLSDIATGLNRALAAKAVGVSAQVQNGALVLNSIAYGSAATFQVQSTASGAGSTGLAAASDTWQASSGIDVAGTINGKVGTGAGQILLGAAKTGTAGLVINVKASAADVAASGDMGTISYTPGVAQALAAVANSATDSVAGTVAQAIKSQQTTANTFTTEIASWNPILQAKQILLTQEFTAMETALAKLKTQTNLFTPAPTVA